MGNIIDADQFKILKISALDNADAAVVKCAGVTRPSIHAKSARRSPPWDTTIPVCPGYWVSTQSKALMLLSLNSAKVSTAAGGSRHRVFPGLLPFFRIQLLNLSSSQALPAPVIPLPPEETADYRKRQFTPYGGCCVQ